MHGICYLNEIGNSEYELLKSSKLGGNAGMGKDAVFSKVCNFNVLSKNNLLRIALCRMKVCVELNISKTIILLLFLETSLALSK